MITQKTAFTLAETLKADVLTKRHSEVFGKCGELSKIYVILNLIQDLLIPMVIKNQTNRFRIKSGMTDNRGLLRCFAPRNDVKFLVPQCLSNLVPFCSLAPCGRGQGEGLNPCKKKAAFTLAEVLITLGIIGVVAAMTIPNLIAGQQKRATVTKLQRAISVLNQTYKLSFDEVGELDAETTKDFDSKEYFNTYWAPYIKVLTYCTTSKVCGYDTDTPWTQTNNQKSGWYVVEPRLRSTFMTMDGFVYVIFLATWADASGKNKNALYQVIVDLNGAAKPNKFGKDVFWLSRVQEDGGGIRPYCYDKTDVEVNADCSKSGVGECCAEKIRRAGWEIEKDYPW